MFVFFARVFGAGFAISFKTRNLHQITSLKDLALTGSTFKFSLFNADYKLLVGNGLEFVTTAHSIRTWSEPRNQFNKRVN